MEMVLISKRMLFKIVVIIVFFPTSHFCFIKFNNFLSGKDYEEEVLEFIRSERR